jgi:hypothetical protein
METVEIVYVMRREKNPLMENCTFKVMTERIYALKNYEFLICSGSKISFITLFLLAIRITQIL